ncbi:MAG: peptide-methionine (S)-S-oxide reductase MsrA [Patescibacteria group bacterium]
METAVFGGGCFWCTEAVFKMLKGVESVEPGYAGGTTSKPNYHNIGDHAEVIRIEYDPGQIRYEDLLTVFFASHDPTTVNRQGADVGEQYRSVILSTAPQQQAVAEKFIEDLNQSSEFGEPIVTTVQRLIDYYPAEDYHQNYYQRNQNAPYCQIVINPKLAKVKERFARMLVADQA